MLFEPELHPFQAKMIPLVLIEIGFENGATADRLAASAQLWTPKNQAARHFARASVFQRD